jgi:hypothetical protein
MKKNIVALYFLFTVSIVSAIDAPFGGSINRCKDFLVSVVGENSKIGQITPERIRKWKTCLCIIMNYEKYDDIISRLFREDDVDNTLDELLELSRLVEEHCRSVGKKSPVDSDEIIKRFELLAFLTSR